MWCSISALSCPFASETKILSWKTYDIGRHLNYFLLKIRSTNKCIKLPILILMLLLQCIRFLISDLYQECSLQASTFCQTWLNVLHSIYVNIDISVRKGTPGNITDLKLINLIFKLRVKADFIKFLCMMQKNCTISCMFFHLPITLLGWDNVLVFKYHCCVTIFRLMTGKVMNELSQT